ncbi:hypothetical protein ACXYUI_31575, partial [Klebsiella pneumoniae]
AQPVGTANLGWTIAGLMTGSDHALAVIGARVASNIGMTPVLARRSRDESWLLHDDGRAEGAVEPAPPYFLTSTDIEIHSPY